MVGIVLGAAAGAVFSFLLLTERGRQLRQDLEPELDALLREAKRIQTSFQRVRDGVSELRAGSGESWPRRTA
jgi:gas vesicle protein